MIMQVGGSISFSPKGEGKKAEWLDYDTRHMLAEIDAKAGDRHGRHRHLHVRHHADVDPG